MLLRLFANENLSRRYISCNAHPYWSNAFAGLQICKGSSSYAEGRKVDTAHAGSDIFVSLVSTPSSMSCSEGQVQKAFRSVSVNYFILSGELVCSSV